MSEQDIGLKNDATTSNDESPWGQEYQDSVPPFNAEEANPADRIENLEKELAELERRVIKYGWIKSEAIDRARHSIDIEYDENHPPRRVTRLDRPIEAYKKRIEEIKQELELLRKN